MSRDTTNNCKGDPNILFVNFSSVILYSKVLILTKVFGPKTSGNDDDLWDYRICNSLHTMQLDVIFENFMAEQFVS